MNIGLTYDLRSDYLALGYTEDETAEFDRDDTITAIESALQVLGYKTERIGNARKLTEYLVKGKRWSLVFNIAEGLNGIAREAQVPAILDLYEIRYTFSDPLIMSLTLHKGITKKVVRDSGFPTPDFYLVEHKADALKVSFDPPFFVKPVAEGTGKGITQNSVVWERENLQSICKELLCQYHQPVLVEKYLSGREFTVGIVGTGKNAKVLGTLEVLLLDGAEKNVYSYFNKEHCEKFVEYHLGFPENDNAVQEAENLALKIWRILGCRDGGRVDLRCDEYGEPFFLEVNPLPGLHPEHSDLPILCNKLGISYVELINQIVTSAISRLPVKKAW